MNSAWVRGLIVGCGVLFQGGVAAAAGSNATAGFVLDATTGAAHAFGDAHRVRAEREQTRIEARGMEAPGLSFQTASVSRQGYECIVGEPSMRLEDAGVIVRRFPSCSESWRNDAGSSEQRWNFDERPTGHGDLVVRVDVRSGGHAVAPVQSNEQGLVYEVAGVDFLYGHGTWVDAAGETAKVPARFADGALELRVPAEVVERSAFPAMLDPVVSADLGTGRAAPYQYSSGWSPAVAFDGENYLLVFEDGGRIRGTRVAPSGEQLDLVWLDIGEPGSPGRYYPSVAFGNGRYVVTWWETSEAREGVFARAVLPDGSLVGEQDFAVSPSTAIYSSVVHTQNGFLLAYWDTDISVARLSDEGELIEGSTQLVSDSGQVSEPYLAAGDDVHLVAYAQTAEEGRAPFVARIDAEGNVLDPGGVQVSEVPVRTYDFDLAYGAGTFFLGFGHALETDQLLGVLLDEEGDVLTEQELPLASSATRPLGPALAFDGENFLATWTEGDFESGGLFGVRVSPSGQMLDAEDQLLLETDTSGGAGGHQDLLWAGERYVAVFRGAGIQGAFVSPDAELLAPGLLNLSAVPAPQGPPRGAFDGDNYVIAWTDERFYDPMVLWGARVSPEGHIIEPDGFLVSDQVVGAYNFDVASNGQGSVFAWHGAGTPGVFSRSIDKSGEMSEIAALSAVDIGSPLGLASNGDGYLAAWVEASAQSGNLQGRLLSAAGTPQGEEFVLGTVTGRQVHVYALGEQYAVFVAGTEPGPVFLVSGSGEVLNEQELTAGRSWLEADSDGERLFINMAYSGSAWTGRYLLSDGSFDGEAFELSPGPQDYAAAVAWDGAQYVIAREAEEQLWFSTLSAGGEHSEEELLIERDLLIPQLIAGPPGQLLATYMYFDDKTLSARAAVHFVAETAEALPVLGDPSASQADGVDVDTEDPVEPAEPEEEPSPSDETDTPDQGTPDEPDGTGDGTDAEPTETDDDAPPSDDAQPAAGGGAGSGDDTDDGVDSEASAEGIADDTADRDGEAAPAAGGDAGADGDDADDSGAEPSLGFCAVDWSRGSSGGVAWLLAGAILLRRRRRTPRVFRR